MKTIALTLSVFLISFSIAGQTNIRNFKREQGLFFLNKNITSFQSPNRIEGYQNKILNKRLSNLSNPTLKSANVIKQRLDSVIYEGYDELSGKLIFDRKETYSYDSRGLNVSHTEYNWEESDKKWYFNEKGEFLYDSNGNLTLETNYKWVSTSSKWIGDFKNEYFFDSNGNLTIEIYYEWDSSFNIWIGDYKIEYSFDSIGNLTIEIFNDWDSTSSKWIGDFKYEFTYDSNGNLEKRTYYEWDSTSIKWVLGNSKTEYTYDTNGNFILEIDYRWDSALIKWVGYEKFEYTYDPNGNLTTNVYYQSYSTSEWTGSYKTEYTYDSNGNITNGVESLWNITTSKWTERYKIEYVYDNSITFFDLIYPHELMVEIKNDLPKGFYKHKIIESSSYSINEYSGQWYIDGRTKTFYSEQTITGIEENPQGKLIVYPNPSKDHVIFDIITNNEPSIVELYDSQGRMVLKEEIHQDKLIHVKHLHRGLYIYKLNYDNTIKTGKIVLQ